MRHLALPLSITFLLASAPAATAQPPQRGAVAPQQGRAHPEEVALVDEGPRGSVFRHFPTGLRLYTSDLDPPGRSICNSGCATRWPPVRAPDDAQQVGDWTIVIRDTGEKQWAYKGKPLYVRIHDTPETPAGDGDDGGKWHLLPYSPPGAGKVAARPASK